MKLAEHPKVEMMYGQDRLIIPIQKGQNAEISDFMKRVDELDLEKEYTVKIEEKRRKRSLDSNAYLWVLIGKLAEKLYKSNIEVYRELIMSSGSYQVLCIQEKAFEDFRRKWESNGDGWVVVDMGESKIRDCKNMKVFAGSSTYDTKQMSRLLDATILECKEQGIETLTPEEIQRMMNDWRMP